MARRPSSKSPEDRAGRASPAQGPPAELLVSVVDSLDSVLIVFDRSLRLLRWNRAAEPYVRDGDDAAAALNRLSAEGSFVDWASELRRIMRQGRPRQFDAASTGAGGAPAAFYEVRISPLLGSDAEVIGGLVTAGDVTARIGMERRLAVAERLAAVGRLAARVAHELNNPLDGILRFASLAQRRIDGERDPKLAEYLAKIKSAVARMGGITSALLDFSRASPGGFDRSTINRIVEDALSAMEGRIREREITVACSFLEGDMPVARSTSLFQVFCNLVKNSVDAMPDGGTLTIRTNVENGSVAVSFEDTGVGLPAEAERIFEPFFTTKPAGEGTGLGLAVCKDLIEHYGGSITAERGDPIGTTMTVRIPVHNCAPAGPARKLRPAVERPAGPARRELTTDR